MVKTYEITCPECNESTYVSQSPGKREGATTDCPTCKVTLIFKQRKVLNFHKWLHNQSDGLWPEDGKGAWSIDLTEDESDDPQDTAEVAKLKKQIKESAKSGSVEIRPRTDKTEMPRKGEFIGE